MYDVDNDRILDFDSVKWKSYENKKTLLTIIAALILLCIASGAVYLRKNYVKIEGRICKSDIKKISPDLRFTKIKEINRCTDVEEMLLSLAYENAISSFADFKKLSVLSLSFSRLNSSDSKKWVHSAIYRNYIFIEQILTLKESVTAICLMYGCWIAMSKTSIHWQSV